MRADGVSWVLVYCADYRGSHWTRLDASRYADDVRLSDIEPRFVCEACGHRGADVRQDWQTVRKSPAAVVGASGAKVASLWDSNPRFLVV
ncbi:hypothetical protein [Bradyrhizobium sp. STM 3562]|uniref:hypothetical protein n=1 Tax=Bradyrhizobium sp. STM 3562 TaxID=578924 RepID=UPI00388F33A7